MRVAFLTSELHAPYGWARYALELARALAGQGIEVVALTQPGAALAEAGGGLLTATSANESGQPPCRALSEMPEALPAKVDVLLDAGILGTGTGDLPSTIVDLTSALPRLVRPGCIPWEIVEGVLRGE